MKCLFTHVPVRAAYYTSTRFTSHTSFFSLREITFLCLKIAKSWLIIHRLLSRALYRNPATKSAATVVRTEKHETNLLQILIHNFEVFSVAFFRVNSIKWGNLRESALSALSNNLESLFSRAAVTVQQHSFSEPLFNIKTEKWSEVVRYVVWCCWLSKFIASLSTFFDRGTTSFQKTWLACF